MYLLAQLLEDHFPHHLISPYTLIIVLFFVIFFLNVVRIFDVGLFARPIWYDLKKYRIPKLFARRNMKNNTGEEVETIISRPEFLTAASASDENDGVAFFDWRVLLINNVNNKQSRSPVHVHVHEATVTTSDIDLMLHQNNSRYLREADLARFEWLVDSGLFHSAWNAGLSFVTASQTIRYRRELRFGVKYKIVTRCVGWDAKAVFLEQLFVVVVGSDCEVHAILEVREGIVVPKKIKDKFPQTADAPLTWIMREVLKWDYRQIPQDEKQPPRDFANWLTFLSDNYTRVIGFGSPTTHSKKIN